VAELSGVGIDRETADRKRKGTYTTELDSPVVAVVMEWLMRVLF